MTRWASPKRPTRISLTKRSGGYWDNSWVKGMCETTSMPYCAMMASFSFGVVSSLGASSGRTTFRGCGSNETRTLRSPRSLATRTSSSSTSWWPRCTPSNVPTVTALGLLTREYLLRFDALTVGRSDRDQLAVPRDSHLPGGCHGRNGLSESQCPLLLFSNAHPRHVGDGVQHADTVPADCVLA